MSFRSQTRHQLRHHCELKVFPNDHERLMVCKDIKVQHLRNLLYGEQREIFSFKNENGKRGMKTFIFSLLFG